MRLGASESRWSNTVLQLVAPDVCTLYAVRISELTNADDIKTPEVAEVLRDTAASTPHLNGRGRKRLPPLGRRRAAAAHLQAPCGVVMGGDP